MNLDASSFVADKELLEALKACSSTIVCEQERRLFLEGECARGLYILRRGSARLSMESTTGGTLLSTTVFSGSILGLPALMGNQPYSLSGTAEEGAELGFVTRENLDGMTRSNPSLALKILKVLAAQVRSAEHAISRY